MAYKSLQPTLTTYKSLQGSPKISDIYNSLFPSMIPTPPVAPAKTSSGTSGSWGTATRTLPGDTGTYESPIITQKETPVVQQQTPAPVDYSKYTDPVSGKVMSPQEYADFIAKRATGGSIPNYAGNSLTQGPQTTEQLTSTATDLNNQRNDIAVGETDPYKAASQSGIAYSPAELSAIEKAYAGIYDPAIKDVYAKLDKKAKEDASALDLKNQLALQAQKHKDDIELKQTASGTSGSGLGGTYVPGENPTVDAWAQRIFDGASKITDIPAASGLRNAVTVALQAYGNQANGKPTTTEIGLQTLDAAKRLKKMFDAGQGTSSVGGSRIFGYGAFPPPGTDAANFTNLFNTLIANRSLEGVKFLKGQGQVSDAERLLLKNAMSELNLSQGETAFGDSLQAIIDKLEGNKPAAGETGGSTGFQVTDPDGGIHTFPDQASADEFKKAIGQ